MFRPVILSWKENPSPALPETGRVKDRPPNPQFWGSNTTLLHPSRFGRGRGWVLLFLLLLPAARAQQTVPPQSPPLLERAATLSLKVPRFADARQRVLDAAAAQGAAVLDSRTEVNPKGRTHGWLRLGVGAAQMQELLNQLSPLGTLYAAHAETTDNTSLAEELGRRTGRLQEHETRLAGILGSNRRMRGGDILFLQERLFRASVDESLLTQQRLDLERDAQSGTILVELFEPGTLPPPAHPRVNAAQWFAQSASLARSARDQTVARAATASAYAVLYAPFWVPVFVVALVLLTVLWRKRRQIGAFLLNGVVLLVTGVARLRGFWERGTARVQ